MAMRRGSWPQGRSREEGGTPYVDCTLCIQRLESSDTYGKKLLKGNTSYDKVFINEDLTTLRFKLLHCIKSMDLVKSVTTRDGKMHCQMKNGRKEVVENPDDLFKLGVNNITYMY